MTAPAWDPVQAAARGARFLDEREPEWFQAIDLKTLYLNNCHESVLGQLFGSLNQSNPFEYGIALFELDEDADAPASLGFEVADEAYGQKDGQRKSIQMLWAALTSAWRAEIERRRAEGAE